MARTFRRGDMVTVLPPYSEDPVIVAMQLHGRVAEVVPAAGDAEAYTITLGATWPPDEEFGPFPAERLRPGWLIPK